MTALTSNNRGDDAARNAIIILDRLSASPLKQADVDRLRSIYRDAKAARIKAEQQVKAILEAQ